MFIFQASKVKKGYQAIAIRSLDGIGVKGSIEPTIEGAIAKAKKLIPKFKNIPVEALLEDKTMDIVERSRRDLEKKEEFLKYKKLKRSLNPSVKNVVKTVV